MMEIDEKDQLEGVAETVMTAMVMTMCIFPGDGPMAIHEEGFQGMLAASGVALALESMKKHLGQDELIAESMERGVNVIKEKTLMILMHFEGQKEDSHPSPRLVRYNEDIAQSVLNRAREAEVLITQRWAKEAEKSASKPTVH